MASRKSRLIGYARVSTADQDTGLQVDALKAAGSEKIFEDTAGGGAGSKRSGLAAALASLTAGDVLIVWRLDRLGRSLPHLLETVAGLEARGVGFRSISDAIDTTSAGGRLVFHIMASLAEFERALIGERTKAGMAAAKSRGAMIGRRRALTSDQLEHAKPLVDAGQPAALGARTLGVGRSTLYRALSPN